GGVCARAKQVAKRRGPPPQAGGGQNPPASICRLVAMGRRPRRYAWRSHMTLHSRPILLIAALAVGLVASSSLKAAENPKEIRVDWATYNPVSMLLKEKGYLE